MNAHQAPQPPAQEATREPHYYEIALTAAIKTDDEGEACNIVERMYRYSMEYPEKPSPQLTALVTNKNFLMKAIRKNMYKLAADLFDTGQYKKREIMLQKTKSDVSLVSLCIAYSNLITLRRLLRVITEVEQGDVKYDAWLSNDKDNDNPFHFAAREENSAVYLQALLAWLEEGKFNPSVLVNAKNKNGDTPFHLLFENSLLPESIRALISYGADLNIPDADNLSAMDHLTCLDPDRQLFLLIELNKLAVLPGKMHCGQMLLESYRSYLIQHPDHTVARSVYFRARALLGGLQSLLYAHHEFNPKIPLRNPVIVKRAKTREEFFTCQEVTPEILLKAEYKYPAKEVQMVVADHPAFQQGMPIYIKKLGLFGETSLAGSVALNKRVIDDIADDINQLLRTWQSRRKRQATGAVAAIESVLAIVLGLMLYFRSGYQPDFRAYRGSFPNPQYDPHCASKFNADPEHYCNTDKISKQVHLPPDSSSGNHYVTIVDCVDKSASIICNGFGTLFVYAIGFFLVLAPVMMLYDYFNQDTYPSFLIRSGEWQAILEKLKQKILQPLSLLNGEVSQFYPGRLKELNAIVDSLKTDLSYEKALPEFKKMLTVLTTLRQEVEQKKCAFPVERNEAEGLVTLPMRPFHLTR